MAELETSRCRIAKDLEEKEKFEREHKRLRREYLQSTRQVEKLVVDNDMLRNELMTLKKTCQRQQAEMEDFRSDIAQLREDLLADRTHLKLIAEENHQLRAQERVGQEGFILLSQTDVLNKRLLESFMLNFDQVISPSARLRFKDDSLHDDLDASVASSSSK